MLSPRHIRRLALTGLGFALLAAIAPIRASAQDTLRFPASSAPAASAPAEQELVTVPDLAGRTVAEARRLLAGVGLEVGRVAEGTGGGTAGTVMQQQPRAGSVVAPKSDVRLWLVPGGSVSNPTRPPAQEPEEARVDVPSLEGRTVADARAVLGRVGLVIGGVTETSGDGEPGTIARQEPRAGTSVAPKSGVRLWLVTARRAVVVPPIIGLPPARAQALLREAGLRPGAVAGTGVVIRHTFQAGASVPAGSVVDLTLGVPPGSTGQVAVGPDTSFATPAGLDSLALSSPTLVGADSGIVPDVRGMPLAEAQSILAAAGYAAAVDSALADSAAWTVSAQQPSGGGSLAAGGVVALLLNRPAPPPVAASATAASPAEDTGSDTPAVRSLLENRILWVALGAVLLVAVVAGVAAGVRQARRRVLPVTAVRARLRMDEPARVAVEGAPFRAGHLRFRMNPGRTATHVSAAGPLFVRREVSGD